MKAWIWALGTASLLTAANAAVAYELIPTASATALYSDNIARASTGQQSDMALDAAAGLEFRSATRSLTADIAASDLYRYYVNNTFEEVQLPHFVGTADWHIAPGHLSWFFEDEYGQVAPSPFYTLDPTQLKNTNFATSGPTLTLPLGQTNTFEAAGTYSLVNYANSDIDSRRTRVAASLSHAFSQLRSLSLNFVREDIKFTHPELYPKYTELSEFFRLTSNVRVMSLLVDAGVASLDSADIQRQSKAVGSITAYRRIGAVTTAGIDVGRRFSDSAEAFRFDELGGQLGSGAANVPLSAAPYLENSYAAFINVDRVRESFRATFSRNERNAVAVGQTRVHITDAALEGVYRINARDSIGGSLDYERDRSTLASGSQLANLYSVDVRLVHAVSRTISLSVAVDRYMRRTSSDFNEDRVGLYLAYRPGTAESAQVFAPYRGRNVVPPPAPASTLGPESPASPPQ